MKKTLLLLLCGIFAALLVAAGFSSSAAERTVYLSGAGSDAASGAAAAEAKKTLSGAYAALGSSGGTVVLCGPLTLDGVTFPESSGEVRFTSLAGGVDYRQTAGAVLTLRGNLCFSGETVFEEISFSASSGTRLFARGHSLRLGQGLSVSGSYPTVYGGGYGGAASSASALDFSSYSLTVESGTWGGLYAGNFRNADSQPMGLIRDVQMLVTGGTFVGSSTYGSVGGAVFCGLSGDLSLTITGGVFRAPVYLIGREGNNTTGRLASFDGNVSLTVTGGTFTSASGFFAAKEPQNTPLSGDYALKITGGVFPSSFALSAAGVKGRADASVHTAALASALSGFSKTLYLSPSGSASNSGLIPSAPLPSFAAAAAKLATSDRRAVLVLLGSVPADLSLLPALGEAEITASYLGTSYPGALSLAGSQTIACPLTLSGLSVSAESASLNAGGHTFRTGAGVSVTGSLSLDGGASPGGHALILSSGSFAEVRGGRSDAGAVTVALLGGSASSLCGASGARTGGDVSLIVAGTVTNALSLTENGAAGSAGAALFSPSVPASLTVGGAIGGDLGVHCAAGVSVTPTDAAVAGEKLSSGLSLPGYTDLGAVRFVASGASGNGLSPLTPTGALSSTASTSSASVVLLGTLRTEYAVAIYFGPGRRSYGGSFCCVDYSAVFGSELRFPSAITFSGEGSTEIAHTSFVSTSASSWVACGNRPTVVRASVSCRPFTEAGIRLWPSLCGGIATSLSGTTGTTGASVTVEGGEWQNVYGGNARLNSSAANLRSVTGDLSVTVRGGRFHGAVSGNGQNNLSGHITVTVEGGVFDGSLCAMTDAAPTVGQSVTVTGDADITVTGGAFRGDLLAFRAPEDVAFSGHYSLTLTGGDFSRVNSVRGTAGSPSSAAGLCSSSLTLGDTLSLSFSAPLSGSLAFENPIASFADPSVTYHDGWYYYAYSREYEGKPAIWLTRAANLADIGASTPVMIWSAAVSGQGAEMRNLWAPQIRYLDGGWYIYCTCCASSDSELRRPFVWVGNGPSPYDGFSYFGVLENTDEQVYSYLSPRILEHDGRRYLVCGGFFRKSDRVVGVLHRQSLFLGELASPTSFVSGCEMVQISTVTYAWEGYGTKVMIQEGPFPLYAPDGTFWLAYSANQTYTDDYCTGLLRFTGSESDPLTNAALWEKQPQPIHQKNTAEGIFSPGAMIFLPDPSGQTWAVYHAKRRSGTGYNFRFLYAQPVSFSGSTPVIAPPPSPDTVFTLPLNPMPVAVRIEDFDDSALTGGRSLSLTLSGLSGADDAAVLLYPADLADQTVLADAGADSPALALAYTASRAAPVPNGAFFSQAFTFPSLPAGSYKLALVKPGRAPRVLLLSVGEQDLDLGVILLRLRGDLNGDGAVNAKDALQISRYAAGKSSLFDPENERAYLLACADINGDGAVNARDALQISRYAAGKPSLLDMD